jgi:hypothetical protein
MPLTPRAKAQAIASGRGGRHTLAVPLAPRLAARIAERPWEAFLTDPTQLANGLGDLLEAVRPDGLVVTSPTMTADAPEHREAALEATRRLRTSQGDAAVLLAVLAGPDVLDEVKAFLDAGVDGVVLTGDVEAGVARTVGNVCRFHRAMAHGPGLAELVVHPLDEPAPSTGLVLTDGECGVDTDVTTLVDWVAAVRGGT